MYFGVKPLSLLAAPPTAIPTSQRVWGCAGGFLLMNMPAGGLQEAMTQSVFSNYVSPRGEVRFGKEALNEYLLNPASAA